ncbi:hypothetical protein [Methanogenium cariaci]
MSCCLEPGAHMALRCRAAIAGGLRQGVITMSDTLRIMVRTKTRRSLRRDEAYAKEAAQTGHRVSEDAQEFLKEQGFIHSSYLSSVAAPQWGEYGSAMFSTLRDATPHEVYAWLRLTAWEHHKKSWPEGGLAPPYGLSSHVKRLEGKELILEVVKGGDANDS